MAKTRRGSAAGTVRAGKRGVPGELLARSKGLADGIATLFFPYVEVIVHDLQVQRIVYIANNLSRRKIGDDSALERAELSPRAPVIGPYAKRNYDGATMRSVSVVIESASGAAIGLVCINLNIGVFEQARAALDQFVTGARLVMQPKPIFQDDWQERVNTFVHSWLGKRQAALPALTRDQKRELVQDLYASGAFKGRSAAAYIARVLNMGRATVFKHVRNIKEGGLAPDDHAD